MKKIPLEEITLDPRLQMRARMNNAVIEEYAEVVDELPPSKAVQDDDGHLLLTEGWHRFYGFQKAGRAEMPMEVRKGTFEDAMLEAAGSNDKHGLRRTNEDKHKTIEALLAMPEWAEKTDRWIAEQCHVNHELVGKIRANEKPQDYDSKEDAPCGGNATSTTSRRRKGRGGRTYKARVQTFIMCDRCSRFGKPSCSKCKGQEQLGKVPKPKAERKPKKQREQLKDAVGNVLPDSCRDAFADPSLGNLIDELESIAALFSAKSWVDKAGKLTTHYGYILIDKFKDHAYESLAELQLAIEALKAGVPYAVCPKCGGVESKGCRGCRGYGHVPETRYAELS